MRMRASSTLRDFPRIIDTQQHLATPKLFAGDSRQPDCQSLPGRWLPLPTGSPMVLKRANAARSGPGVGSTPSRRRRCGTHRTTRFPSPPCPHQPVRRPDRLGAAPDRQVLERLPPPTGARPISARSAPIPWPDGTDVAIGAGECDGAVAEPGRHVLRHQREPGRFHQVRLGDHREHHAGYGAAPRPPDAHGSAA